MELNGEHSGKPFWIELGIAAIYATSPSRGELPMSIIARNGNGSKAVSKPTFWRISSHFARHATIAQNGKAANEGLLTKVRQIVAESRMR